MEIHTLMPVVREAMNTCPEGARYCALKKFVVPPLAEVDKVLQKKTKHIVHSSLAFAICALKESSNPSTAEKVASPEDSQTGPVPSATPTTSAVQTASRRLYTRVARRY